MLLGHQRSGTNFATEVLQRHPAVECLTEPLSMHTGIFRELDLEPWDASSYQANILHRDLRPFPVALDFLTRLRAFLESGHDGSDRRRCGFKETTGFAKLDWIRSWLPGLNIILLVRDPRAVVCSVLSSRLYDLWEYSRTVPPAAERVLGEVPASDDPFELVVWSWKIRMRLAEEAMMEGKHHVVRLEDLMEPDNSAWSDTMGFLGLSLHSEQKKFIRESGRVTKGGTYSAYRTREHVIDRWKTELGNARQRYIAEVLEYEMEKWGYGAASSE